MLSDELYLISKENFWFLRDCILEYWNEISDTKNGQLHFIKDSVIAERVVCKYLLSEKEKFLNFFYKDVLQLTGENYKKDPTGKDIEQYFENQGGKKYVYKPEKMNGYLDKAVNAALFREECGLPLTDEERLGNSGPFYPKLLIERLQTVAYDCLKEYLLCNEDDEDEQEIKKEKYFRFVTASCFYEIFVRKFLGEASFERALEIGQECDSVIERLDSCQICMQEKIAECKQLESEGGRTQEKQARVEELKRLEQELCDRADELKGALRNFLQATTLGVQYYHHISNLAAFSVIISIIEFNNVNNGENNVSEYIKRYSEQKNLLRAMEEEYSYLFMDNVSMNKNARNLYLEFMETMKREQVLQELCSCSKATQEQALKYVKEYIQKVKSGEYKSEKEVFAEIVSKIARKCIEMPKK